MIRLNRFLPFKLAYATHRKGTHNHNLHFMKVTRVNLNLTMSLGGGGYFAARPGNSSKADAISVFVGAKVKLLFSCFR